MNTGAQTIEYPRLGGGRKPWQAWLRRMGQRLFPAEAQDRDSSSAEERSGLLDLQEIRRSVFALSRGMEI